MAGSYNWDNGFDIPNFIIDNERCDLGTALMLFYYADGYRMLDDELGFSSSSLTKWKEFLEKLYAMIINKNFKEQNIVFNPPLTKVQLYKLKRNNINIPKIFLEYFPSVQIEIPNL